MKSFVALSSLLAATGTALAHDGHGLQGSHWHPTDAWGFVALAVVVTVAVFFSRGGK
ncbi:MAG: hypothetical protein RLZZ591_2927 [Pseudomonadota bacterium]|jgi:hypothetical protein